MNNSSVPNDATSSTQPSCQLSYPDTTTKVALTVVYAVVFIVALLGNCAIILIAKTKKRIRKVAFNFFIISMATADLLDALFAVPIAVFNFYFGSRWFGGLSGDITCKVFHFLETLSLSASVLTLAAISVDRYLAIVHVLRKPLSKKKVKIAVFCLWLFASLSVSTYLIKYRSRIRQGEYHCFGSWSSDLETNLKIFRYEVVLKFVFLYIVPLSVMTALYSLIIRVLKRRQAFGENMSQHRIQAQNMTVTKMVVTIVLLFALCWIPNHVIFLMVSFSYNTLQCAPISVLLSLIMPIHANGAINPCIYLIFNESYRKGLKQLLVKCRKKPLIGIGPRKSKGWPGSSTLESDLSRGGIRGFFRDLSKVSRGNSEEVTYETRF